MKVMIMTDLEGVSCAGSGLMWERSTPYYPAACVRLMADVNVAIRASFDAGADTVLVYDGHCGGGNFIKNALDPRAVFDHENQQNAFDDCEAFVLIGGHAKAGTAHAFLDHTQTENWFSYTINGIPYGELAQEAIYCGTRGIPVVAFSGDKAACEEAAALIPGIECAAVKTATGQYHADCLPAEEAEQLIYDAVYRGVQKRKEIKPFTIDLPAEICVTYIFTKLCDEAIAQNPDLTRVDGRTVCKTVHAVHSFLDILP